MLIVCSLSLTFGWSGLAAAQQVSNADQSITYEVADVMEQLAAANVVYLGETHSSAADHAAQLDIIEALHQRNADVAIAMEMFQQPFQTVLDEYLAGTISEAELRERSQYDQRWGFPWEYYAPMLRYAQTHDIPVIALNVPTEITRRVAEKGLGSLTARDRQYIPPVDEIDLSDADYRAMMLEIYKNFHSGHGAGTSFERFFLAQVLWDETMAAGVVNFLQENPSHQVIVLAGQGHIAYDYGIPNRVARRLNARPDLVPDWSHTSVLLNPSPELSMENANREAADYLWQSEPQPLQDSE
jgi:uncharacterized iron-regulated protein